MSLGREFVPSRVILRRLQTGTLGKQQAHGCLTVVLAHRCLEVGGRQIFRMRLMRAPLHEEAVADAAEQTSHEHAVRVANPATVIVVGNVQTLVEPVFNAGKTGSIELQPPLGVELGRLGTGNESNVLVLAALALAEQSSRLRHQRETNLLRGDRLGPDGAADDMALFPGQSTELGGRRLARGGNPPWGRGAVSRYFGERWAGYL